MNPKAYLEKERSRIEFAMSEAERFLKFAREYLPEQKKDEYSNTKRASMKRAALSLYKSLPSLQKSRFVED